MVNMPSVATIINSVFPPLYLSLKARYAISTSIRLVRKACDEGSICRTIVRMYESLVGMDKGGIQIGQLGHGRISSPSDYETRGHTEAGEIDRVGICNNIGNWE
jgi:hypothetical protein